ncbi:HlyD family efflux transporter periplasmic adaptor subunit [Ruegeria sp.]|uniref:HlyD family efflux transporter periplasmic adaptor subunit n=1 Tax=Ruegeria sp. TaxID=1879320 RepID=UPI003B00CA1D
MDIGQSFGDESREKKDTAIILLSLVAVLAFVAWSSIAEMARVVRADGRIVTATRTQIVQNLEGGIIESLNVEEGDHVTANQEMLRLDPTRFAANVDELEQKITALEIRRVRLEAEATGQRMLSIPSELTKRRPKLSKSEMLVFYSHERFRNLTKAQLDKSIELRKQEISLMEPLVGTRAVSELQLINAKLELSKLVTEKVRFVSNQEREIATDITEIVAEIDILSSTLRSKRHQLDRTLIKSPTDGVVNQLFFPNAGAVVGPGEPILEIVPAEDSLLIQARVEPKNIGFVTLGMRATLKVTAYDYRVNGTLSGHVVRIGADTVPDQFDPRLPHAFIVSIEVDQADRERWLNAGLELRNGLLVNAELQAKKTRVIDYILRPVFRAKAALSEL